VLEETRRFYDRALRGVTGPVLECACGTGLIFLPLLASGHDMYGFDISTSMLDTLRAQAAAPPADDPYGPGLRQTLLHAELLAYLAGRPRLDLQALLAEAASPSRAPVGPPTTLRTEELLGEAQLKAGRPREAIAAYERALQLTPNRSTALLGLARARHAAGDEAGAADAYRKLLDNWRDADPDLPALAEARSGAGTK